MTIMKDISNGKDPDEIDEEEEDSSSDDEERPLQEEEAEMDFLNFNYLEISNLDRVQAPVEQEILKEIGTFRAAYAQSGAQSFRSFRKSRTRHL